MEEGKTLSAAPPAVALTQEQHRLALLEVELAKAKAEVERWSGLVSSAILEKAPDKEKEEYKGERSYWEGKVDKLERQITDLKRESFGKFLKYASNRSLFAAAKTVGVSRRRVLKLLH